MEAGGAGKGAGEEVLGHTVKARGSAVAGEAAGGTSSAHPRGGVVPIDALGAVGGGLADQAGTGTGRANPRQGVEAHHAVQAEGGGVAVYAVARAAAALPAQSEEVEGVALAADEGRGALEAAGERCVAAAAGKTRLVEAGEASSAVEG